MRVLLVEDEPDLGTPIQRVLVSVMNFSPWYTAHPPQSPTEKTDGIIHTKLRSALIPISATPNQ